jgi:stearoyl-CoA desaturase (delta-9 desaturase)
MVLSSRPSRDGPAPGAAPLAAEASDARSARGKRDSTAISSPYLHRMQRRHFLLFDVLPFVGTLAALALLLVHPLGWVDIGLFLALWLLTGIGLTVGYHRLFTHQSFSTGPAVAIALLVLGSMAGRGPMLSWVAMHRRHHERSDREGDMHSPNLHGQSPFGRLRGWAHAHLTWMFEHEYPNVAHYVPDLLRDRTLMAANQRYYTWVVLGLALPALLGGALTQSWMGAVTGFLWDGVVRMFAVEHCMSAVNSFLHLIGSRPFNVRGDATRGCSACSRGARAGTTTTTPSRTRLRSASSGISSIWASCSFERCRRSAWSGTSRCRRPPRSLPARRRLALPTLRRARAAS